mgnify:CR=1 FL=1
MSHPDGGPAFSRPWSIAHDGTKRWWREAQDGMTLRQWYAGEAMKGLISALHTEAGAKALQNVATGGLISAAQALAILALSYADALIAEEKQ